MITAQVENLERGLDELKLLLPLHYRELALDQDLVPLDPDYDEYIAQDRAGHVCYVTLRDAGALIGYFVGFVRPGLHYQTCMTCIQDIFYVVQDSRGQKGGQTLFAEVERELKRRGVMRWIVNSKCHFDASWMFERLGFDKIETIYSKMIGD